MSASDYPTGTSSSGDVSVFDCHHCKVPIDVRNHGNCMPEECPHCGGVLLSKTLSQSPERAVTEESLRPMFSRVVMQDNDESGFLSKEMNVHLRDDGIELPWDEVDEDEREGVMTYRRVAGGVVSVRSDSSEQSLGALASDEPIDDKASTKVEHLAVPSFDEGGHLPQSQPKTFELAEDDILEPEELGIRARASQPGFAQVGAQLVEEFQTQPNSPARGPAVAHGAVVSLEADIAPLRRELASLSEQVEQHLRVLHKTTASLHAKLDQLNTKVDSHQAAMPDFSNFSFPTGVSTSYPMLDAHEDGLVAPRSRAGFFFGALLFLVFWSFLCVFVLPPMFSASTRQKLALGHRPAHSLNPSSTGTNRTKPNVTARRLPALPPTPASVDDAIPPLPQPQEPLPERSTPAPRTRPTPRRRLRKRPPAARRKRRPRLRRKKVARRLPPKERPKSPTIAPRPKVRVVAPRARPKPGFVLPAISTSLPLSKRCDVCARKLYASTFRKLRRSHQVQFFGHCNKRCDKNWTLFRKRFLHWCKFRNLGDGSKCSAALKRRSSIYQYQTWLHP